LSKIVAVYEIMWINTAQPGRPHITIWRMQLHAGYLRLQTHTQSMQQSLFSLQQQWFRNAPQCYVIRTLPVLLIQGTRFEVVKYKLIILRLFDWRVFFLPT